MAKNICGVKKRKTTIILLTDILKFISDMNF